MFAIAPQNSVSSEMYYIADNAMQGNVDAVMKAIGSLPMTWRHWQSCIEGAAEGGQLDLLKTIHQSEECHRAVESFASHASRVAAHCGHVHVLEWLDSIGELENGVMLDAMVMTATFYNHAEVLKFLRKFIATVEYVDMTKSCYAWRYTLENGIHDFIDVLYDHMYGIDMADFTEDCAYLAGLANLDTEGAEVSFGHAECLRFLRSRGFPWNPDEATRARAAAIGIE